MYCQTCGIAVSQQMKYCNRCGAQLIIPNENDEIKPSEKRLDEYLDGLFWITLFGLGLILGGMTLMKGVGLSNGLIVAYLILSSTAFLVNFALSLWGVLRIVGRPKSVKGIAPGGRLDTNELGPALPQAILHPAPSVTENTTRSFEPIYRNKKSDRTDAKT